MSGLSIEHFRSLEDNYALVLRDKFNDLTVVVDALDAAAIEAFL